MDGRQFPWGQSVQKNKKEGLIYWSWRRARLWAKLQDLKPSGIQKQFGHYFFHCELTFIPHVRNSTTGFYHRKNISRAPASLSSQHGGPVTCFYLCFAAFWPSQKDHFLPPVTSKLDYSSADRDQQAGLPYTGFGDFSALLETTRRISGSAMSSTAAGAA